jgi:hypothetical protein
LMTVNIFFLFYPYKTFILTTVWWSQNSKYTKYISINIKVTIKINNTV